MPKTGIFWLADMHSGSPYSLFGGESQTLMNGPHSPSALQIEIYKHWRETLDLVALWRNELDRLIVINVGDAVEGLHHGSKDVISSYLTDHKRIHEKLMLECKEAIKWDRLYYVNGTLDHAGEEEFDLATVLGAERYQAQNFTHPVLKKTIYRKLLYVAHHGPGPGKGFTKGNALRNRVREIDYDLSQNGDKSPDMVVYAHHHQKIKETVTIGEKEIQAYILPSWKLPDPYLNRVSPFAWSNIGAMITTCSPDGLKSEFITIHIEQNKTGEL